MSVVGNSTPSSTSSITNTILKAALRKTELDVINICHFNAGSIFPKIDGIRDIFAQVNVDVLIFSETWFKTSHSNNCIEIPGYKVYRNDRFGRRGGGVAVFVKEYIRVKIVSISSNIGTEYLFLELIFPESKLLVAAIYKAPDVDEISLLNDALTDVICRYDDVVIVGDINENILSSFSNRRNCPKCVGGTCSICRFLDVIDSHGLASVGQFPTNFVPDRRPTLIDLVLSNNIHKFAKFGQVSSCHSTHDILYCSYIFKTGNKHTQKSYARDFNSINMDQLFRDTANYPWNAVYDATSSDEIVTHFQNGIIDLMDIHAPYKIRHKRSINETKPWFTDQIRRDILERDIAYIQFRRTRSDNDLASFRHLRNRATQSIRRGKAAYFAPRLNSQMNTKQLWQNLRNLGMISSSNISPSFTANDYVEYLSEFPVLTPNSSNSLLHRNIAHRFSFSNTNIEDVYKAIMDIRSNAVGLDGIPIRFVKMILPILLPVVTYVFNFILTTSVYPSSWKSGKVMPVHKKTRSYELKDFRPVTILPALSKAFERIMKTQIISHLNLNRLYDQYQSGFRAGYSTTTALLKVTEDIRSSLDKGQVTVMVLLDFSRAFDTVDCNRLCEKLDKFFGFDSTAISLIRSYLVNRSHYVVIAGAMSNSHPVLSGVPQGTVLGPILFTLFTSDLRCCINNSNFHCYADDTQLYISGNRSDCRSIVNQLNDDLRLICTWAADNAISLNPSKSKAIVFSRRESIDFPPITISGITIPYSSNVKNLGLVLNNRLLWTDHVKSISARVFACLRSLWLQRNITPLKTRIMLAKSLLVPHLTYCDIVFSCSLDSQSKEIIKRAVNSCARYVYNIERFESVSPFVVRLLGCSIFNIYDYHVCIFIYKLSTTLVPSYLHTMLQRCRSERTFNFNIPRHYTLAMNLSFFVRGIRTWNSLPAHVKSSGSVAAFRDRCFRHMCG